MQVFIVRHTWEPASFDIRFMERFRWASPVHPVRERTYQSKDSRTWALFHEIPTRLFPEGACYHRDDNGLTLFDGHAWPIGMSENYLPTMAAHLRGLLNGQSVDTVRSRINGEYALVHVDEAKDEIVAFCDPAGMTPLYYAEDKAGFVVSNRLHAIMAILGGEFEEFDLSSLAFLATWGYAMPGKTVYKRIGDFGPGCVLKAQRGKLSVERDPSPLHNMPGCGDIGAVTPDVWESAVDEIATNVTFLRYCPEIYPTVALSGGKDSRACLSVALRAGVADRMFFMTRGFQTHPDVVVAKEITDHFSLPHVIETPWLSTPVDSMAVFEKAIPQHMWLTECMVNAFEPHAIKSCGADPVLTGLNGEVFRSVYDNEGFKTVAAKDASSAKAFLEKAGTFNTAGLVRPEVEKAHQDMRRQWADQQLALGVKAEDLPGLYYALFNVLRRSCGLKKVNGFWNHTIHVLNSPKLYWLAFNLGAESRRREQTHFEVINRGSAWLAEHHFAFTAWHPALSPKSRWPKPVLPTTKEQKTIQQLDWRTHIDINPEFRKRVQDYILNVPAKSDFWQIIDRKQLERFFTEKEHSYMSRFHFYGALTVAMALEKHRIEQKMSPESVKKPLLVKQEDDTAVYVALQGKIRPFCSLREYLDQGKPETDIRTLTAESMQRFTLDESEAVAAPGSSSQCAVIPVSGFHRSEKAHTWIMKDAVFQFESDADRFSFLLAPGRNTLNADGCVDVKVTNDATGEIAYHQFSGTAAHPFIIDAPVAGQTVTISASSDFCPADHGGSDERRLALMFIGPVGPKA